ncbi:serine/threonine-protein kinase [Sphaerisporangium sp. TRM90804]|uniref:serine/threonine-protein kinase n=1 Tax=Sphaerisporangium sp. TRM90804 TaxID=3031113 RepID=UPI00244CACF5|nr:serine/threonine-protein kinase [Sphaerisporangium sp. TRM90804]MDH2427659.1 serine/threonine-protein kinase [Sphaerisporangium sp. TRM90804]
MSVPTAGQLGPYRLLSRLGAGGFGEVHLALDPQGRTVAVKVLHPQVASDQAALARLAREVETMRRVRGPHIAEVLDASMEGTRPYLVTRYVQGRALGALVAADGPLRGDDLWRLARGLAEALATIHAAGIVHRDLKPANVILADGEPNVIDFGIAYALDSASVTTSGTVLGTPGYLAPEVLEGGRTGPEADVFAWGATLAYAATGRHPFGTGPAPAVAYRVVHHAPDLGVLPSWMVPLVPDCLSRDPAARPTAEGLCVRLGADLPVVPAPRRRPPSDGDGEATQVARPARREERPPEDARVRQRRRVHRRWVAGTGIVTGLTAAAVQRYVPELTLLVLGAYGVGVVVDAGVGVAAKERARVVFDLAGAAGTVGLYAALSSLFSPSTLLLALVTVLIVLVTIAFAG